MRKFGVADLILNATVSPLLTLIAVAKPWIESSPALSISHVLGSAPGWVFSQATGFVTGGSQGAAWAAGAPAASTISVARASRARRGVGSDLASILVSNGPAPSGLAVEKGMRSAEDHFGTVAE